MRVWAEPFTTLRLPKLFDLFADPYERADITSNTYYDYFMDHAYFVYYGLDYVTRFCETLKSFPRVRCRKALRRRRSTRAHSRRFAKRARRPPRRSSGSSVSAEAEFGGLTSRRSTTPLLA